jgi:uncharacterized heparinase superfamily protein
MNQRSPADMNPVLARQLRRPLQNNVQGHIPRAPKMTTVKKPRGNAAHKPSFWQTLGDYPILRMFSFLPKAPYNLLVMPPDPWSGNITQGRNILQNKFYLHGQRFSGPTIQWKPDTASPDWLTAMHSFEWLRDLRSLGGDQARRAARLLVKDWLLHYKRWDPVAWRPDITGARIAAWIGLHDFFLSSADDGYRMAVFEAIQKQSRYLLRVLPGHMKGSRLITALKGQIYACLALPNSQTRLFQALALLQDEINKQILPDGGHIERNPATHMQVLQNFLDIRGALRCAGLAVPEVLQQAIRMMAPMLRFYCHGDAKLAILNGSSEGDDMLIDMILQQAHANGKPALNAPHTGYERMTLGRSVVMFDVGTPPLPGYDLQVHAAPLAFEFSVARERMIVNCGHAGTICPQMPMAMALRNTAAHSTAIIANTNALELRSEGGIGRHPKTIHLHQEVSKDQILVAASHDGYQSNLGVIHNRQLYLGDAGEDLRGQDTFIGNAGHPFAIRFHLAPDVRASMTADNTGVLLRLRSGAGWRFRCHPGGETQTEVKIEESIYVPQSGEAPKKALQIVLTGYTTDKEIPIKWNFRREKKLRTHAEEKLMLDLQPPAPKSSPTEGIE